MARQVPKPGDGARNVGHGHVHPRPDGRRARCGGPGLCGSCSAEAVQKQAEEWDRFAATRDALQTLEQVRDRLAAPGPVDRAEVVEALSASLADLQGALLIEEPPPPPPDENPYGLDMRVHSRACGIVPHGHGAACHANCPTCHGRADFPHEGMAGEGRRAGL